MKLLSKEHAENKIRKDNETLVETNIRLRALEKQINDKLNSIKEDYSGDKLQKLQDFERFCKDLQIKKEKLLSELAGIQKLVDEKKDVYYGLIEKKDKLDEMVVHLQEKEARLNLRESFVEELEKKQRELIS